MVNYPTEETMTAIRKKVSNKIKMGIAPIFFLLLAVFCLGAFCNFAYAADLVWDGGGVDDNFSTAANWVGDAAPAINDNVTFNAGAVNCVLDAFDLGTGDFIVTSGYSGTFSSSGTFKCDVCTLNLTNAAWSITNQFETGTTDHGAWTITAGTFTTSAALYVSGNIIIGVGGAINQTGQWTVMRGAATKTISNLGGAAENDITFYKFEENSDTNGGAVAKTQIQCNIAVGAEGMFTNGWNQATDGYFVIGDGTNAIVVTVSGGYYNKGKSETLANSKVSVAGDIEFNDGNCWGFDTSAGGTFEWTGAAGRHVWPNSNTAYSFYDFILSGSNTLNHQVNDIYITNNFTITDGILYMTKSMYVTGNIALSGDAILRPLGDDNPGQVRFGGTLSCAGTSKVATELAGTGAAPNNYVEIIGSAGALRAFTGVTASLDQSWLEDGINEIRFNNVDVQFDLTSQGTGEKLALTGDSTFDAITLNGSAATSFTTGAYTATLGGAFINTFGAVTISASGAINIGANAFMSNTANSIVATSGALTCGDLTIAGTFTNTAANTIFSTGNVEISVFGATAANNTLTMDCTATLDTKTLNASVPLGNFTVNSSGTIQLLTSALDVDGNFRLQAGTLDCNSLGQNYAGDYQRDAGTTYTSTGTTTTFDGTAAQTATSNSLTYNTITITNSHADGVIFADAFTTATLNDTTASSKLTFNAGDTYTITGAAGLNLDGGAAGTEITLISDLAGTKFTFDVTGGDQTVTYVNVKDSAASGNDITANTSINSGGNDDAGATPQWVFGNVARYWIAAGNSDWDTNANWSSASGGTGPADYPDAGDTAIFDNNVASNCTLDAPATIAALDVQAYAGIISCGTNNFTTSANMTVTSGAFTVGANTTQVGGALKVDGGTGTFTSGALDCNGALDIQGGALTAPDGTGGNFNVAANWSHSGGTFNHSSGTVIFDTAAASTIADNTTFYNLTCTQAGKQINFTNGTTQTANNTLTLTGTSGNLITLRSTAAGSKWDITLPNGAQTVSFIDVKDADANTNTITCYTSTDSGNNNTNWVFKSLSTTTPEAGKTVGQQPTIRGSAGAGDTVTIKGTVGTVAYQTVAQVTADANGNYIVRQANYSATLDAGANNIRADVGVTLGAPVNVTVVAAPTINQVPTISSPVDGGKVSSEKPALSGSGLAGQNVTVSAWDADANLLLTDVAAAVVGADGTWSIVSSSYTSSLVKGTNYLIVTVAGVASDVVSFSFTDPFGIVFDSSTNEPIANAIVTIYNQNGTLCVAGTDIAGSDFNPQTTGADGAYSFLCANGNFYITVEAPGYTYPSKKTTFPTGRVIVTGSKGEIFTVAGVIIEMDHPLDSNDLLLKIKKETNKKEAVVGDIVTYTVTIKNIGSTDVKNIFLEDRVPGGFKYINGKAILDNIPTNPAGSTALLFDIGTVNAQTTRTLKYQLVIGSGVTFGNYENTAWARYSDETVISNKDHATVKITPDPLFDLGTVIGKVFWDEQEQRAKGEEPRAKSQEQNTEVQETEKSSSTQYEPNLADIQIVMEDGAIVTTDKNGKYHIPALTLGRHLLRIDERTLPEGAYLTTDKVVVIDVTPGILSKVNFGVKAQRAKSQEPRAKSQEQGTDQPNHLFFIAMGDAKLGYTFHRGSIEPIQQSDKFRGGFWSEGKLAYYLKGKVLGRFLITSSLDTDRKQKELFRNLDPDKYYPVYGDSSTIDYKAADTQGALYLLVEWDKSSLMWGNHTINFTDTDLASFKRTLYGAKLDYKTVSTTKFDQPNTKLILFKAKAQQQAAHVEFLGTGGSLFYLKHKDIIEGSEKITIEVRDKITGLTLASLEQEEGFDYEIDYDNGRIIFWEPVSHTVESDMIISTYLLNNNPVYVTADYEYEALDKYDRGIYGARVEQALGDYLSVGGTYVKEEQVDNNYELTGTDTTLRLGDRTKITAEYAESRSEEVSNYISTDGGLSFTELLTPDDAKGKAYGIKGTSTLIDGLSIEAYYKKIEEGFSSSRTISEQAKELTGGSLTYDITDKTRVTLRHDTQKLTDNANPQAQLQTGADKTQTTIAQITHKLEKLKLTAEYRKQEASDIRHRTSDGQDIEGDTVALKADYKLNEKVILSLEQQAVIKGSANHQTTAGIRTKVNEKLTLRVKQALGTKGAATSLGAGYNLTDKLEVLGDYAIGGFGSSSTDNSFSLTTRAKGDNNDEIYHTYSMSNDALEGKKYSSLIGTKKTLESGLEFTIEEEESLLSTEKTNTNIFGLSGNINDKTAGFVRFERGEIQNHDGTQTKRNAVSLGGSYVDNNRLKVSSKLELRVDKGENNRRQYLSYNAAELKANDNTTLFAKVNLSRSDNTTRDIKEGMYKEFITGAAYRPVYNDRLNLLARYTYLEDSAPSSQSGYKDTEEEKSHIVAVEAVYDLTDNWQLVQKLALRMGEEKVSGFDFTETRTWLNITRLNYRVNKDWKVGGEYRLLTQKQADDYKQGALLEVSRGIGDFIEVGAGYNFTDFNDDLTHLDYTSHGPFIRVTGMMYDRSEEEKERARQKALEKNIKEWAWQRVDERAGRDKETKSIYEKFALAQKLEKEGRLEEAKALYKETVQRARVVYIEEEEYIKDRVRFEKELREQRELAERYFEEGRLEEAKKLWRGIIDKD